MGAPSELRMGHVRGSADFKRPAARPRHVADSPEHLRTAAEDHLGPIGTTWDRPGPPGAAGTTRVSDDLAGPPTVLGHHHVPPYVSYSCVLIGEKSLAMSLSVLVNG